MLINSSQLCKYFWVFYHVHCMLVCDVSNFKAISQHHCKSKFFIQKLQHVVQRICLAMVQCPQRGFRVQKDTSSPQSDCFKHICTPPDASAQKHFRVPMITSQSNNNFFHNRDRGCSGFEIASDPDSSGTLCSTS